VAELQGLLAAGNERVAVLDVSEILARSLPDVPASALTRRTARPES